MTERLAVSPPPPRHRVADAVRATRAIATNQLARVAPQAYVRLTGQTGRGDAGQESAAGIARYFRRCAQDYFDELGLAPDQVEPFLRGKALMEYGPGDLPGVALLMVAFGAERVVCVDRFPLLKLSDKNARVVHELLDGLTPCQAHRLRSCLIDPCQPRAGFEAARIDCVVSPSGLSGRQGDIDLVFSRAVLEHVNDLPATFADMVRALRPGARAVHQVDLESHGLHRANPLDFLAWTPWIWDWMYSEKGVPNRWRVDEYRRIVAGLPVEVERLAATKRAAPEQVTQVRPLLAERFRRVGDEDLAWLGFWLVLRKKEGLRHA